jgi:hypothetical protein
MTEAATTEKMAAEEPTDQDLINLWHDIVEGFTAQAKSLCVELEAG